MCKCEEELALKQAVESIRAMLETLPCGVLSEATSLMVKWEPVLYQRGEEISQYRGFPNVYIHFDTHTAKVI